MKSFIKASLLVILFLHTQSVNAASCDARQLPEALHHLIADEDYSGAEKLAKQGIASAPQSRSAQINLAKVYINSALRSVVNIDPNVLGIDEHKVGTPQEISMDKLKLAMSDDFVVDREYEQKAEDQIDFVVKRWPEERSLLYCLTKIGFYARDHDKFLSSLHRNAEAFADSEKEAVGFFLGYGEKYFKRNDFKKAADVYDTLLKTFPKNAPLLSSLGVTYLRRGHALKAATLFDQAYHLAPRDEIIIGNIAELAMWTGDAAKAERFLKIKATMQPKSTAIYFDLAINAMRKGARNSLPYWDTYFQQDAKFPDDKPWSHAAGVLQQGIKDGLDEAQQLDLANQFIETLKAPKYAIPMMMHLQEQHLLDAAFPYAMAHAYDRADFYDLAEASLLEAYHRLQKGPSKYMDLSSNQLLYNLARMTYGQERYQEALNYLDMMKKTQQEQANTAYLYGLAYLSLGKRPAARQSFALCKKASDSENLRHLCEQQEQQF